MSEENIGVVRGSIAAFESDEETWLWKLRDGKLIYLYEYADRSEALRAAGLS